MSEKRYRIVLTAYGYFDAETEDDAILQAKNCMTGQLDCTDWDAKEIDGDE